MSNTITGEMLSDAKGNFDVDVINAHRPRYSDVEIARYNDGSRGIIVKNLPFNFADKLADGALTEDEAQSLRNQMITGNKTFKEMCQVVSHYMQQK